MSEYYSPRPALISNPAQGIVFNYPNKAATAKINTPAVLVFQTADPVLFSPLTDGLFEKVCHLKHLHSSFPSISINLFSPYHMYYNDNCYSVIRNTRCGDRGISYYSVIALCNL